MEEGDNGVVPFSSPLLLLWDERGEGDLETRTEEAQLRHNPDDVRNRDEGEGRVEKIKLRVPDSG